MKDIISKSKAGVLDLPPAEIADRICDRPGIKASLLVADDDPKTGKQFLAILDRAEYDGVVAGNGQEAIDQFLKSSFDIVFTALKMPGMDGLTVSLQVKAASVNTPVVLMLDYNLENIMSRIKAGRIDCVMLKPFRFGAVQKTVHYFATNH